MGYKAYEDVLLVTIHDTVAMTPMVQRAIADLSRALQSEHGAVLMGTRYGDTAVLYAPETDEARAKREAKEEAEREEREAQQAKADAEKKAKREAVAAEFGVAEEDLDEYLKSKGLPSIYWY